MSDGLSECRREERAMLAVEKALNQLDNALDEVHDAVFGLPPWAYVDLRDMLAKYGVHVVEIP